MNIAVLGYGLEGKSIENYFKKKGDKVDIFAEFPLKKKLDAKKYDYIFRSPSIPVHKLPKDILAKINSSTQYFFSFCPVPIIGVTGTKGKGTTCTMITKLLEALGKKPHLVGNIGEPALDHLDELPKNSKDDIVIFELSSFQLWDLKKSPAVSVVLRIEPDHLNVHKDFDDYVSAKANIVRHQSPFESTIYFKNNADTVKIADQSPAEKFAYPISRKSEILKDLLNALPLVGEHNKENLEAALLAVYAYFKPVTKKVTFNEFLKENQKALKSAIKTITPLPHHIELIRELNNVKYYDDSFCTVFPALDVALKSFSKTPIVLIAGGSSKGTDLAPAKNAIFKNKNLVKAVLIGETAEAFAKGEDSNKYILAGTDFRKAIETARNLAEATGKKSVVLLSPCAASFDMFKSYKDRGDQFKKIVKSLK